MKSISFFFDPAYRVLDVESELLERLFPEIERVGTAWGAGYQTDYAALSLPSDLAQIARVKELAIEKKKINARMIIVIGIGGSNLGAMALFQALGGSDCEVRFADTVDAPYCNKIYAEAQRLLERGDEILLIVISKSGSTTETVANAQLFTALVQKMRDDYSRFIVVISDEGSALHTIAQEHGISYLPISEKVGGRFSVFSAVGLFPLALIGIDISALCEGAESMKEACTTSDFSLNPSAQSAAILYHAYRNGQVIHDTFVFSHALFGIGQWYRQLLAESIGKAENREGEKVSVGITPTTSIGSVDLHSVTQLALAGPSNRITTFISVQQQSDCLVPKETPFDTLVPMIQNKTFNEIMDAILQGTQAAYVHAHRPYMTIELPEISAYYCGQLLQMKMVEIMYLGFLFNINPFDQPQVEWYKKETRKILSHE